VSEDGGAAVAAAERLATSRSDELFGLAVPLSEAFGLDAPYDVWPLLDVDDAALDELIGDFLSGSDESDVEFESIRVPG
jgi:hypothetical protein